MIASLTDQLIRDEELRQKPYLDCCGKYWRDCTCQTKGKLTIGVGRNLDDVGIGLSEAAVLLANDIKAATVALEANFPWTMDLDDVRKGALLNMTFNMGIHALSQFDTFLELMKAGDYKGAAADDLHTLWAKEVGPRAQRISMQIESGYWQ
jgi:lysozyme